MLGFTTSFLYGIILVTGSKENVIVPIIIITIMTAIAIPLSFLRANYVIKKKEGVENRQTIKAPPFWLAVVIASVFSRLTLDGMSFSITVFMCAINFYVLYSTLIPNVICLYYAKKYRLECEIPVIFIT